MKKITKKEIKRLEKREVNRKDREWKDKVKERDNATCQRCGRTDYIHIHHLFPREIKGLRWDINNGLCLCPFHHKFSIECSPHRNALSFFLWFMENKKEQWERLVKNYKGVKKDE